MSDPEKGLSRQYHASPERLSNMHAETQRRLTNEQQSSTTEGINNGQTAGPSDQNGGATHPGGEGGGTQEAVGEPQKIITAEKTKPKDDEEPSPNLRLQNSANRYAKAQGMPKINHEPVQADTARARAT